MKLWINPSKMETAPAKYMNHACIPNCVNEMWGFKGMPRVCFFANRKIKSGEELTFNYGWELLVTGKLDLKKRGTECLCGAENCFGNFEKGVLMKRTSKKIKKGEM